jgi:hypothetical protein
MSARTWVCGVMMVMTTSVGASHKVSMKVSPSIAFAPATLVIRTRVEPDADNREMDLVAESDEFYSSSTVQLDGDRAPLTSMFQLRGLPSGEYEVTASVAAVDGQRVFAHAHVQVLDVGASR